jgi:hypothetical protein
VEITYGVVFTLRDARSRVVMYRDSAEALNAVGLED